MAEDPLYGASTAEWATFAKLCLPDLLPTVCDPNVQIHPGAEKHGQGLDKVPSGIDSHGYGYRIAGWPTRRTTGIDAWVADPRLGICVIARTLHAIDIDIPDLAQALHCEGLIREYLGIDGMRLPVRVRGNSGKRLLPYRLIDAPDRLKKDVTIIPGQGMIEWLHEGQQFRVAGRHATGYRLRWEGLPDDIEAIPVIEYSTLVGLQRMLCEEYNVAPIASTTSINPKDRKASQIAKNDPCVQFLHDNDIVRSTSPDGSLNVHCPWVGEHKHPTPDNVTEARFFPIGLGEIKTQPGFRCMHATCHGRTWQAFLNAVGYEDQSFPVTVDDGEPKVPRPTLSYKGKSQLIAAHLPNVVAIMRWSDGFGYAIRYDEFKDNIVYHNASDTTWRVLNDEVYTQFRLRLHTLGMETTGLSKDLVRDAVHYVSRERSVNTAQEWLKSLHWDGVKRIDTFHTAALKVDDTPYHHAVARYLWTALAGRVMQPGSKADMALVLTGAQGLRKSSFAEALAPSPDEYTPVSLTDRDSDLARQLRGKMVAEWDELKGLSSRDAEGIRAWVSRATDEWIPKFKEYSTSQRRHFVLIGTSNEHQLLNDPTGARRFLPVRVRTQIDTDYVKENREQLWAEGRELWLHEGIAWAEAERLAKQVHKNATMRDLWQDVVMQWMHEQGGDGWTSMQILSGACSIPLAHANRSTYERLRRVMARLGYEEDDEGRWVHENA